jgi:hypothetical protein
MDEGKGIALVILGIVAVIAIVGLVLMFSSGRTGASVSAPGFVNEPFSYEALGKYYVVPGEPESANEAWQRLYYRDVAGEYAYQPGFARANDDKDLGRAQERIVTGQQGLYAR